MVVQVCPVQSGAHVALSYLPMALLGVVQCVVWGPYTRSPVKRPCFRKLKTMEFWKRGQLIIVLKFRRAY